jgi:hypothetical protein
MFLWRDNLDESPNLADRNDFGPWETSFRGRYLREQGKVKGSEKRGDERRATE